MKPTLSALLLLLPCVALAQSQADRVTARRVAESLATTIEENYVIPDTGRMIAEHLRARLRSGAYDAMEMAQLADRLSADAKAVNGDLHLYVNHAATPGTAAATQSGARVMMRRPGDAPPPDMTLQARRANFNMRAVERLAGNVGYFAIDQLRSYRSDEAYRAIDAAMAFLEHTDAMILDLRRTPGGEPQMADYVASYFFGPDSVRTLNSYSRSSGQTFERWTTRVAGKQRPGIPVFVLVGGGTASGAEDLAFILQQTGRATLVGDRTAGAGRLTRIYPIGDGFVASVPGGRTYDPRTGKEWERVGIAPDLPAELDDALTLAHATALQRLASAESDSAWKSTLLWTRSAVLARAKPVVVKAETLRGYAGEYGLRRITYDKGTLWYQREKRPREELVPVADGAFALGEAARIEFVVDGARVTAMRLTAPVGPPSLFPRTK